jgi:hypothetical protein
MSFPCCRTLKFFTKKECFRRLYTMFFYVDLSLRLFILIFFIKTNDDMAFGSKMLFSWADSKCHPHIISDRKA